MLNRRLKFLALAAFSQAAGLGAAETGNPLKESIAKQQAQVQEIVIRSKNQNINEDYKKEALRLSKLMTVINSLAVKNGQSAILPEITKKIGARIAKQISRRDACDRGFSSLAAQQCVTLDLSQPRTKLAAAAAGNKILFLGGENTSGPSNIVDIFDSEKNTWTSKTLLATKGAVKAQSVGANKALSYILDKSSNPRIVVDMYDSTDDSWSTFSTPTTLPAVRAAAISNKAVFWSSGIALTSLDVFDTDKKIWSTVTPPTSNAWTVSVSNENKILFARSSTSAFGKAVALDVYDPDQNLWSVVNIPEAFQSILKSGIYAQGKAYFVTMDIRSNYDQTQDKDVCRQRLVVIDTASNLWSQQYIPGCGSGNWSIAESASKIVFVSDSDPESGSTADAHKAYVLDLIESRWDTVALSIKGTNKPIAATKNKIFVGAGQFGNNNSFNSAEVNVFEPTQNVWTAKSVLAVTHDQNPESIGRINFVKAANGRIGGWAGDRKAPSQALKVKFYVDGPIGIGKPIGETSANIEGFDNEIEGPHGFVFTLPSSIIDNKKHDLYAYATDSQGVDKILPGSPFKYVSFKPQPFNLDVSQKFNSAFIVRSSFPTSCNQGCHAFTYEERWVSVLRDFNRESWTTENNNIVRKMRSGQHGGTPFDELSIRLVKAWLAADFPEFVEERW